MKTVDEINELLTMLRTHGVTVFKLEGLEVTLNPFFENIPSITDLNDSVDRQNRQGAFERSKTANLSEDEDKFWSA